MQDIIDFLNKGWVGSTIGAIGIVIGAVISIGFYFKSQKKPKPTIDFESVRLIGSTHAALPNLITVFFKGQPIPRLTSTVVRFWNGGDATLDGSAVVKGDPLRLQLTNDGDFLSAEIVKATRQVNGVSVEIVSAEKSEIHLCFDFLDPGDGVVVECLHTDAARDPAVCGVIKGLPHGLSITSSQKRLIDGRANQIVRMVVPPTMAYFSLALGAALMFVSLLPGSLREGFRGFLDALKGPTGDGPMSRIFAFGFGLTYLLMGLYIAWLRRRRYPKALQYARSEQTTKLDPMQKSH